MSEIQIEKRRIKNATNIFLISDIHLGVRSSSEEWQENQIEFFEKFFFPTIEKEKDSNSILFVLGDVFDDRKSINIAVNELAIKIFTRIGKMIPTYIINGNHDLYKKTNKSATSLRSLEFIKGVTLITQPTIYQFDDGTSISCIPYLGNIEEETKYLLASSSCNYAFMHTDISQMKYDNYREIQSGINASVFPGMIFSGHIHKRQENGNIVYVGSPYQMRRSDIGNKCGIYHIEDLQSKKYEFIENTISPIFQKIDIEYFFSIKDNKPLISSIIDHNYTDILVKEEDLKKKYKPSDIYNLILGYHPKRYTISVIPDESKKFQFENEDLADKPIDEMIYSMIDSLDDKDDAQKQEMKELSKKYLKVYREQ